MLNVKGFVIAGALFVASAMPAAAQGNFGLGVSFLGDEGGTGFIVDYSAPLQKTAGDFRLNWVGDFSWHRNSEEFLGIDADLTNLFAQGGLRIGGPLAERLTWHAQGLLGLHRISYDDNFSGFGGVSDNNFAFTPGAAVSYAFGSKSAVRAQLDIPVIFGDSGDSTTRFGLMYVLKTGGN